MSYHSYFFHANIYFLLAIPDNYLLCVAVHADNTVPAFLEFYYVARLQIISLPSYERFESFSVKLQRSVIPHSLRYHIRRCPDLIKEQGCRQPADCGGCYFGSYRSPGCKLRCFSVEKLTAWIISEENCPAGSPIFPHVQREAHKIVGSRLNVAQKKPLHDYYVPPH